MATPMPSAIAASSSSTDAEPSSVAATWWQQAEAALAGLPDGGLNLAFETVDRHVLEGHGDRIALRWLARDGRVVDISYAELARRSHRFAHALEALGVAPGERLFTLLGRTPELFVAALGCWRHGAVLCPLFSAFGPEPIASRMAIANPTVLVTDAHLYTRKIVPLVQRLPFLRHVILVDDPTPQAWPPAPANVTPPNLHHLSELLARQPESAVCAPTTPSTLATLHFTSGTTGTPKAAMHVHGAVAAHRATAAFALDLQPGDVYWCTADPGWVTGTSYGIIAPLAIGCTLVVDEDEFDANRWYRTLAQQQVSVWYTAPTAIRMLMRAGNALPSQHDLSALRFIASVGEPLNPEAVLWAASVLGRPIHDNWWQSETGGIMVANTASMPIKPGSMGKPLPGIEAAVVTREGDHLRMLDADEGQGELALRAGWPSMFRGYLGEEDRYRRCFVDGWYLSGDIVRRDVDGYYWFVARGDDVIKTSGHLVGPFEVESALLEHPAVAEAAVIGVPDEVAGEVVQAFVALKPPHVASEALTRELLAHARKRLGPAVAPRNIEFREALPHTRSGKLMRRLLRAQALGLPEGDTSTLESSR